MFTVVDARKVAEQVQAGNLSQVMGTILAAYPASGYFRTNFCVSPRVLYANKPLFLIGDHYYPVSPSEAVNAIAAAITWLPMEGMGKVQLIGGRLNVKLLNFREKYL